MIISYIKDGIFGFKSENLKIEFNNAKAQMFDENGFAKEANDILYYYYDITGYIKDTKWKKYFEVHTYDFPEIVNFKYMLEMFINKKLTLDEYQKNQVRNENNSFWYTYSMDTGLMVDDYYSINHQMLIEGQTEIKNYYNIFIGKALNFNGSEVYGTGFNQLSFDDIKEIYKCVCAFIKDTINTHNKQIIKEHKKRINSWTIHDKKLYKFLNKKDALNSIFVIGDKGDLITIEGDLNSDNFYSCTYRCAVIKDILDNCIIIEYVLADSRRGEKKFIKPEKIELNKILYFNEDIPYQKLKFSENEITKDFISILSENEKEEFLVKNVDELFYKWNRAIINRTWMYRKEHDLPKRIKDNKGKHENVKASVKEIIKRIKEELKNNFQ